MADSRFPIIELGDERCSIALAPAAGGRLLRWTVDGEDVIHWPGAPDWTNPAKIRGGNPLLFPFLGRHQVDGEASMWRDAAGIVRAMPAHGFARDLPFGCHIDKDGRAVELELTDSPATLAMFPFHFALRLAYRLRDGTLDVSMTVANTGAATFPYYAGHHFYFSQPPEARGASILSMPRAVRRHQLPDGSIGPAEPGMPQYRLDDPRLQDRFHVLASAAGAAERRATLVTPALGRTLTLDLAQPGSIPWYAVTTWTERPDSPFYCIEPWLGLPNAIHHGAGLRWLAPGATETAACRLSVAFDAS